MGLENVRLQLAHAQVAEVAGVFRCPALTCAAVDAEVAEVAEVFGGRGESVCQGDAQRLQRSCRGFSQTYARATADDLSTSENHAEVAEVFHSFTRAQAHVRARAREEEWGRNALQPPQPLHAPIPATILRYCRCMDCRHWIAEPHSECIHGIIRNGVKPVPEYPADAWHYCALYHGPQVSKDVWVWPKAKKGPAPSRGRLSGGPSESSPPGENGPNHGKYTLRNSESPQ